MKIRVKNDVFDVSVKKELHPDFWQKDDSLNFLIRDKLLKIAEDFINYLDILDPDDVEDIRFTGSLANYNYTSYSDVDLHIIVDFEKLAGDNKFIESFFKAKKNVWNNTHDVMIKGYEVELYVEDSGEKHVASGLYSVLKDVWIRKPKRFTGKIDKKNVLKKVVDITERLKELVGAGASEKEFRSLLKKIVDMRRGGLEKGGEYSVENLAFKLLRRTGTIKTIVDAFNNLYDKKLSLDEQKLLIDDEDY
jgi:hypothetical protein|tara:strand:- start:957 stop:1703 length:747 start_codon:yes stop_codon:yes gene_type:complete